MSTNHPQNQAIAGLGEKAGATLLQTGGRKIFKQQVGENREIESR
jgi:hypothetical protein